ncbi:MAG: hypothetical protein QXR30_04385 [Candidatus Woesearchaeota archaeon]
MLSGKKKIVFDLEFLINKFGALLATGYEIKQNNDSMFTLFVYDDFDSSKEENVEELLGTLDVVLKNDYRSVLTIFYYYDHFKKDAYVGGIEIYCPQYDILKTGNLVNRFFNDLRKYDSFLVENLKNYLLQSEPKIIKDEILLLMPNDLDKVKVYSRENLMFVPDEKYDDYTLEVKRMIK